MAPSHDFDGIVHQITTSYNPSSLNHTLRNDLPKEFRDTILAGVLSTGEDPLSVLDMKENTLGALYILAARLTLRTHPLPWQIIREFCCTFIPEHARLAPDRVTVLAKGIVALAETQNNPHFAIQPLFDLVRRYPPDPSYLTSIHPLFVLVCVTCQHFAQALPVLQNPIANIDTDLSDLNYNDNLIYHYAGGIAYAALKRWAEAQEFLEICVSSPGTAPAALQLEALKKLKLIQLIATGTTSQLPKYTHLALPRLLKITPYNSFINAYPQKSEVLHEILDKERSTFISETNLGLIQQALDRAPRWTIKKLTATYVTLSLSDIARAVKIHSEDEARQLVLNMIESSDICAKISSDGSVTFSDPAPRVTKAEVDKILQDVQSQTDALIEMEMEMGISKEYLSKAIKSKDESTWSQPTADEDLFVMNTASIWTETDSIFS